MKKSILIGLVTFFMMMNIPIVQGGLWHRDKKQKHSSAVILQNGKSNPALLIDAKRNEITGNIEKAQSLYREYLSKYPEDPVAYFELGRILYNNKELDEALKLSEKAAELDPNNIWYQLFQAEVNQAKANYKESIRIYEKIVEKYPSNVDYYYQLAALYLISERYREAIEVYDKIENLTGISEDISVQKEKIFLVLNDIPRAQEELEKLVRAYPDNTSYLSMLAEFLMSANKSDEALDIYNKIIQTDPNNPYIHMTLSDYYRKKGDKARSFEELKLGFSNPNLDIDTKVRVLLSFYSLNDLYKDYKDVAFELAKILVAVHPNTAKSYSIYGDLLEQDKNDSAARDVFIKAVTYDSSNFVLWSEIMRLDLVLNKFDHLIEFSEKSKELFPEQPLPYLFSGLGSYQKKDYGQAVKDFTTGSKLVVNNDELMAQFFMYMGDAYHALKNAEESDKAYEKSLQAKGDNAYVLNNYAYYLVLRNMELDKAERMAKRAVTLEPSNSSFLDTYGWVLYKMGRYADAEPWVERALEDKEEVSAEVMEHYGDIQYKLGNVTKAVEFWMKAKAKGPGSDFLDKKIADKKLYE
ncbi:MAG: tetratricopeptide repeat protein [Bacteroidota bacterium]|nr:tetratricopeptide repeat protein [Bacteroidota bacterium]